MKETSSAPKRNYMRIIIVVALVVALVWFFIGKNNKTEMIQPSTGDTTSSSTGIPPDSLSH